MHQVVGPLDLNMDGVAQYARIVVQKIEKAHGKGYFTKLVCISNGGLAAGYFFARLLGIKDISVISVSSYGEGKSRGKHVQVTFNGIVSDSDRVLIVDDLVETGDSMRVAKSLFANAKTAALLVKSFTSHAPDFSGGSTSEWVNFPWEIALETNK